MYRILLVLFYLSVICLQTGCATAPLDPPYLSDDQHARIRTLTISANQSLPEIDLSEVEDAPVLRAASTAPGLFTLVTCLLPTPVTITACATGLAPVTGAVAVGEGIEGASKDLPKTIEAARANMKAALARADIQEMLRNKVSDYAKANIGENALSPISGAFEAQPDRRATSKADAVLEVWLQRIKMRKSGVNDPHITLEILARAKLKDVPSGSVLLDAGYRYLSDARTPDAWLKDTNRPISKALVDGINTLAQYISDEAVLLRKSSQSILKRERPPGFTYALAPLYPPAPEYKYVHGQSRLSNYPRVFVQVDSLQPTLRWEEASLQDTPGPVQKTKRPIVVYDFQLFEAREGKTFFCDPIYPCSTSLLGWMPGELIIKRENLGEPRFAIEPPLKACAKYFWTVRAKWGRGKRIEATEWMATYQVKWNSFEPWELRRNAERPWDGGIKGSLATSYLPFETPCDKPQPENT